MEFNSGLIAGILEKRYKRFLADVTLDTGESITAHCPNTGAMTGCAEPGSRVWLSHSDAKIRKYPHTWELVETAAGMACVHSAKANKVVWEAVAASQIPALAGYPELRAEVKYGDSSRADLLLSAGERECYVEVKSVTWYRDYGLGVFPDTVSARATKHLRELLAVVEAGQRAVIFFCALHTGVRSVAAAADIDPRYALALREAVAAGVEAMAWGVNINPNTGITLASELPVAEVETC